MGKLIKRNNNELSVTEREPDKTETWAGKFTARVTQVFKQDDGSVVKKTRKINKDGTITDKLEYRHK